MSGMMSTLHSVSEKIGKAMNLPELFYKPLPLSTLLDTPIRLSRLARMTKKKVKRKTTKKCEVGKTGSRISTLTGALTEGRVSRFAIDGQDFQVCATTWIIGELRLGAVARIKGVPNDTSVLEASSIVIL